MKIEQKFSVGKKGFNFKDVGKVIDLLRGEISKDTAVVVNKTHQYFALSECGDGWSKKEPTLYCNQIESPEMTTSCISDFLILLLDLQYNKNFLSSEIIRFGTSRREYAGPYNIQSILYCKHNDLITIVFGV